MADLTPIIKNFPEVGEVQEIKALTSGLINQTYLVKTADDHRRVLHHRHIFGESCSDSHALCMDNLDHGLWVLVHKL